MTRTGPVPSSVSTAVATPETIPPKRSVALLDIQIVAGIRKVFLRFRTQEPVDIEAVADPSPSTDGGGRSSASCVHRIVLAALPGSSCMVDVRSRDHGVTLVPSRFQIKVPSTRDFDETQNKLEKGVFRAQWAAEKLGGCDPGLIIDQMDAFARTTEKGPLFEGKGQVWIFGILQKAFAKYLEDSLDVLAPAIDPDHPDGRKSIDRISTLLRFRPEAFDQGLDIHRRLFEPLVRALCMVQDPAANRNTQEFFLEGWKTWLDPLVEKEKGDAWGAWPDLIGANRFEGLRTFSKLQPEAAKELVRMMKSRLGTERRGDDPDDFSLDILTIENHL